MSNNEIKKLDMKSSDVISSNIKKIGELFPNVVSEGKINFEALKQELSRDILESEKERYQLTWVGKKESKLEANKPINKTLRPIREKSVNFDSTQNVYIEGDNLEALKILQESYLNKIKCIYIDPPYNTGNDFIYNDNFNKTNERELIESGQIDEYNNKLITNNESNGRFHSDWLSMMYPRLKLARKLLTEDGVMFISIDDNEVDNLKKICEEIFGEKSVDTLVWRKSGVGRDGKMKNTTTFRKDHEYIIVCFKKEQILNKIKEKPNFVNTYPNPDDDPRGCYKAGSISRKEEASNINSPNYYTVVSPSGIEFTRQFDIPKSEFDRLNNDYLINRNGKKVSRIYWGKNDDSVPSLKIFVNEEREITPYSMLLEKGTTTEGTKELSDMMGIDMMSMRPKPSILIQTLVQLSTHKDSIVLDFFSGTGTTAEAVLNQNKKDNGKRKFVLVQICESCKNYKEIYECGYGTICDIGEERIRRCAKQIKEETNADIDYGFRVYKIDSSNMKDVYYEPSKLEQTQLNMFESNIKEDRTSEDLLTQIMLDLGLTLDLSIEEKDIINNRVYFVAKNRLVACFDEKINIDILDEICKIKPLKIVFKESSFNNDSEKINAYERIKKLSPETEINVI